MEVVSLTLHKDGTFGLMYRLDGELKCSCGWPGEEHADERTGICSIRPKPLEEDAVKLWSKYDAAEAEGRLVYSEEPEEQR
jgi:hypothetical protein